MSRALKTFNKIKEGILDILMPKFCFGCGREGLYICKDCEVFLSEVDPVLGGLASGASTPGVNGKTPGVNPEARPPAIVSVWEYEGLIEKLIYKIKFDGCYHIINELVEKAMEKVELHLPEDTIITYVPMWPKKERQRGFNQSALIAKKLSIVFDLVEHKLLKKVRDNRSQVGLGPKEREENVRGAFRYLPRVSHPREVKSVLLVDDIYTTGATINECRRVLKRAGVKNVWTFTLARKMRI